MKIKQMSSPTSRAHLNNNPSNSVTVNRDTLAIKSAAHTPQQPPLPNFVVPANQFHQSNMIMTQGSFESGASHKVHQQNSRGSARRQKGRQPSSQLKKTPGLNQQQTMPKQPNQVVTEMANPYVQSQEQSVLLGGSPQIRNRKLSRQDQPSASTNNQKQLTNMTINNQGAVSSSGHKNTRLGKSKAAQHQSKILTNQQSTTQAGPQTSTIFGQVLPNGSPPITSNQNSFDLQAQANTYQGSVSNNQRHSLPLTISNNTTGASTQMQPQSQMLIQQQFNNGGVQVGAQNYYFQKATATRTGLTSGLSHPSQIQDSLQLNRFQNQSDQQILQPPASPSMNQSNQKQQHTLKTTQQAQAINAINGNQKAQDPLSGLLILNKQHQFYNSDGKPSSASKNNNNQTQMHRTQLQHDTMAEATNPTPPPQTQHMLNQMNQMQQQTNAGFQLVQNSQLQYLTPQKAQIKYSQGPSPPFIHQLTTVAGQQGLTIPQTVQPSMNDSKKILLTTNKMNHSTAFAAAGLHQTHSPSNAMSGNKANKLLQPLGPNQQYIGSSSTAASNSIPVQRDLHSNFITSANQNPQPAMELYNQKNQQAAQTNQHQQIYDHSSANNYQTSQLQNPNNLNQQSLAHAQQQAKTFRANFKPIGSTQSSLNQPQAQQIQNVGPILTSNIQQATIISGQLQHHNNHHTISRQKQQINTYHSACNQMKRQSKQLRQFQISKNSIVISGCTHPTVLLQGRQVNIGLNHLNTNQGNQPTSQAGINMSANQTHMRMSPSLTQVGHHHPKAGQIDISHLSNGIGQGLQYSNQLYQNTEMYGSPNQNRMLQTQQSDLNLLNNQVLVQNPSEKLLQNRQGIDQGLIISEPRGKEHPKLARLRSNEGGGGLGVMGSKRKESKIPFENAYVEDCYKFIVGSGNQSHLIRQAMNRRPWWIEIQPVHSMFNFKWQPTSNYINFKILGNRIRQAPEGQSSGTSTFGGGPISIDNHKTTVNEALAKQLVNHFESHQQLTEKYNLLKVTQNYCDQTKEPLWDYLPVTFYVEISDLNNTGAYNASIQPFVQFWQSLEANRNGLNEAKEKLIQMYGKGGSNKQNNRNDGDNSGQGGLEGGDEFKTGGSKGNNNVQSTPHQSHKKDGHGHVTKFKTFNFDKTKKNKYQMPLCHFDSHNLWILKPTHLNRGRGIHVFRDLETFHKLIKQYCVGKETHKKTDKAKAQLIAEQQDPTLNQVDELQPLPFNQQLTHEKSIEDTEQQKMQASQVQPTPSPSKAKSSSHTVKFNTFVVQKYIERPLLIYKRKFDIRMWVVLTQDADVYFFPEGYLRTTSTEYGIDLKNVDDAFVHLTNNAIQINAKNYGEFEDGNQLNFDQFQQFIDEAHPEENISVKNDMVPQMKEIVKKTFAAVRRTIDPHKRKHCFELFGYDFILDEDFNMFLIEVNTNPCLEESSSLLKALIPRMIEDMLKITVDVLFPRSMLRKKTNNLDKVTTKDSSNKLSDYKQISNTKEQPSGDKSPQKKSRIKGEKHDTSQLRSSLKRHDTKLDIIGEEQLTEANNASTAQLSAGNNNKQAGANVGIDDTNGESNQLQVTDQRPDSAAMPIQGNYCKDHRPKIDEKRVSGDNTIVQEQNSSPQACQICQKTNQDFQSQEVEIEGSLEMYGDNLTLNDKITPVKVRDDVDSKSPSKKQNSRVHPVPGYPDHVNMWEKILCLEKDEKVNTKYANSRSMFTIQVSDRIFKLKKNSFYKDSNLRTNLSNKTN